MLINIASRPAIGVHSKDALHRIAEAGLIAITKHVTLKCRSKNIWTYTLALGNISTEATLLGMPVTKRKNAAIENFMKTWRGPRQVKVGPIPAVVAGEHFAFATGNTIVIDGATVTL